MAKRLPSRRALIVDDEFLCIGLRKFDARVGLQRLHCGIKRKDAMELAKSNRPDVVVMDVYLGGTRAGMKQQMAPRGMWRAYRFCDRIL